MYLMHRTFTTGLSFVLQAPPAKETPVTQTVQDVEVGQTATRAPSIGAERLPSLGDGELRKDGQLFGV